MAKNINDLDQTQLIEDVAREHFKSRNIDWASLTPEQRHRYKQSILDIQTTIVKQIKAQLNAD